MTPAESNADCPRPIGSTQHTLESQTRRFRMKPPATLRERFLVGFENCFEGFIVRRSVYGDPPVYDNRIFPWVADIEAGWRTIRKELDQVMIRRDEMPSFHQIIKEVSTITTDDQWKTFFLLGVGLECGENARRCPGTMRLLQKIPGITTAMFSILAPGKHIPPHRGPYAGVLRLHLGLQVPEPRDQVRIRIGNRIYNWEEGKCLVFDDTYFHEVWNDTNGYRAVLFIDFARPLRGWWHRFNYRLITLSALAPFLREAKAKQKAWEEKFYGGPKPAAVS